MFSVGSEGEAEHLLTLACPRNLQHEFVSRELADEQTVDRLFLFGTRLAELHDKYVAPSGKCRCKQKNQKTQL